MTSLILVNPSKPARKEGCHHDQIRPHRSLPARPPGGQSDPEAQDRRHLEGVREPEGNRTQTLRLPNIVRKWVRRFLAEGEAGLVDRSSRPHHSPRRTLPELEEKALALHQEKGWGRRHIAQTLGLPEGTVRHILRRHLGEGRRKKRKTFCPAHGLGKRRSRSS